MLDDAAAESLDVRKEEAAPGAAEAVGRGAGSCRDWVSAVLMRSIVSGSGIAKASARCERRAIHRNHEESGVTVNIQRASPEEYW